MAVAEVRRKDGLAIIFSFFLGLMVTAFVGVGVYTFYAPPQPDMERLEALSEQSEQVRGARSNSELTGEEKAQLDAIANERNQIYGEYSKTQQAWARTSSIILVILATIIMVISLVAAEKLSLISNGLLLGGVFTMLYGVGWTIASDNTIARFTVITIALATTIALGYIRFVKQRSHTVAVQPNQPVDAADMADMALRLTALEQRINSAATALGKKTE